MELTELTDKKKYQREYYQKNKEIIKGKAKIYYDKNKENVNKRQKVYNKKYYLNKKYKIFDNLKEKKVNNTVYFF